MDNHETSGEGLTDEQEQELQAARVEAGRLLFAKECTFIISVATLDQLPPAVLPEVAFAGRSNVGKSSLINALTGRNGLARASNTPGRTQQINFFDLHQRLMLVDLPGFGFAEAPKAIVAQWQGLINAYLKGRAVLRRTCVLVDSRHGLKDNDREVLTMLDKAAVPYQIVMTKADKVSPTPLAATRQAISDEISRHPAAHPHIIVTSSETALGIAELRAALTALAL